MPISFLYGVVIWFRNFLFDNGFISVYHPKVKTICIGNLSVGGTGKTPHTELFAKLLNKKNKSVAILSRGYGRITTGFIKVENNMSATEVGDEPLQMRQNLPANINFYVCEDRKLGIENILAIEPQINFILLDDAFQHRKVKCAYNILLTDNQIPFYDDYFLPTGTLRDAKQSAKRADIIIVTKCDERTNKTAIIERIKKYSSAQIVFSQIVYSHQLIHVTGGNNLNIEFVKNQKCIVFTGISNPVPFINHLTKHTSVVKHFEYADHYYFKRSDFDNIAASYKQLPANSIIITTQKDAMRIKNLNEIKGLPIYYLPIEIDCAIPEFVME